MYEILLAGQAGRDLKRLRADVYHRIVADMKTPAENPRPHGCKKLAGSKQDWRIRVGEYRVLYEIDDDAKVVRVMRVRHRRDVYR